jgi:hypothetical protein
MDGDDLRAKLGPFGLHRHLAAGQNMLIDLQAQQDF